MFELSDEQKMTFNEWVNEHNKNCKFKKKMDKKPTATLTGRFTYSFTPTGIGEIIEVKCACGKKIDLTDVTTW